MSDSTSQMTYDGVSMSGSLLTQGAITTEIIQEIVNITSPDTEKMKEILHENNVQNMDDLKTLLSQNDSNFFKASGKIVEIPPELLAPCDIATKTVKEKTEESANGSGTNLIQVKSANEITKDTEKNNKIKVESAVQEEQNTNNNHPYEMTLPVIIEALTPRDDSEEDATEMEQTKQETVAEALTAECDNALIQKVVTMDDKTGHFERNSQDVSSVSQTENLECSSQNLVKNSKMSNRAQIITLLNFHFWHFRKI